MLLQIPRENIENHYILSLKPRLNKGNCVTFLNIYSNLKPELTWKKWGKASVQAPDNCTCWQRETIINIHKLQKPIYSITFFIISSKLVNHVPILRAHKFLTVSIKLTKYQFLEHISTLLILVFTLHTFFKIVTYCMSLYLMPATVQLLYVIPFLDFIFVKKLYVMPFIFQNSSRRCTKRCMCFRNQAHDQEIRNLKFFNLALMLVSSCNYRTRFILLNYDAPNAYILYLHVYFWVSFFHTRIYF